MADPVRVEIPADEWTKVAGAVLIGGIYKLSTGRMLQTYVAAGDPAPVGQDTAAPMPEFARIEAPAPIDVYMLCPGAPGFVRVDI